MNYRRAPENWRMNYWPELHVCPYCENIYVFDRSICPNCYKETELIQPSVYGSKKNKVNKQ